MITREELCSLDRKFPLVKERDYKFGQTTEDNNDSYIETNKEAVVWLLDNSTLLLEIIEKYRRITEITFEGKELDD